MFLSLSAFFCEFSVFIYVCFSQVLVSFLSLYVFFLSHRVVYLSVFCFFLSVFCLCVYIFRCFKVFCLYVFVYFSLRKFSVLFLSVSGSFLSCFVSVFLWKFSICICFSLSEKVSWSLCFIPLLQKVFYLLYVLFLSQEVFCLYIFVSVCFIKFFIS